MSTSVPDSGSAGGPTVRRMLLGAYLRRLREGSGISREQAGWQIRSSESKISRLELGRVSFKERDVADLLTYYGVTDEAERRRVLALARSASTPGWWHRYADVTPSWLNAYLGLEAAAVLIRSYGVQFIHGLLQTRDYARAVITLGREHAPPAEVERRVDLRMQRQRLLTGSPAPQLWAVLDEAVLRRPIGGPAVLCGQIEALIEATQRPNIKIQVLPFDVGGHAAAGGPFMILRFADPELPDVVYIEQLTSALYLDKREDLDRYAEAMERLCMQALPPDKTADALAKILKELLARYQ